ncbi:YidC/Oxa1 family membrane protein insertase [uncultured Flavonifractor sp.]|uniref:YidC/Oxa1 family membrane protein insertase n=1 Tax=uncultured Flavonifractor sp. TaxID=1193534 RepID=UPI002618BCE7|nr:YidC/Oxa1 family membrane protein insertase [uncultured Flavonifractor sp.]
MDIVLTPFSWLLEVFYNFCGSYGLALILFALVVKVVLFPLSLKGKRSMIQMNMLQGQMQKLQKQYGNNRERYNEEVQKLYAKEKINPMGGCLWSFIPLIILMVLYPIIRLPIHYMMGISDTGVLNTIAQTVNWNAVALDMGWIKEAVESFSDTGYNQLYLASLITPENLEAVRAAVGEAGSQIFSINFDFLGIVDLSQIPQLKFWTVEHGGFALFLLPVISAGLSVVFSLVSMKTNAVNQQSTQTNSTMKSMMIVSPLISLWIGFSMPAALCIYWIANSLFSMLQEFICGRLLKKDYEKAAAMQAERARLEKEEEKEQRRKAAEERARRIEEEKQNKGKKKKGEKKPVDEDKIPGSVKEFSRVGMRQYARGRAYDPYRYSQEGPTVYPGEAPLFARKPADGPEAVTGEELPAVEPTAGEETKE